jgi:hypothetical protein
LQILPRVASWPPEQNLNAIKDPPECPLECELHEFSPCFPCAGLTATEALIIQAAKQRSPNMGQVIDMLLQAEEGLQVGPALEWLFTAYWHTEVGA